MSRFKVPQEQLDAVHIPADEQVEELEPLPSPPPLSEAAERERQNARSAGGPV